MTPQEVKKIIGDTPHMTLKQAERITNFIKEHNFKNILELGFYHGVSTCYMAAAIGDDKDRSITTIDLEWAKTLKPTIEELLTKVGKKDKVTIYHEPTSYTWRLMKLIEENPEPIFDFCYLDGAHDWFVDGFAFFLVDRLLKPGGWIIFDDLYWSYGISPTLKNTKKVQEMPADERDTFHVKKIFDLLVQPHPSYGDFYINDGWGYAHKIDDKMDNVIRRKMIKHPNKWVAKVKNVLSR